MTKNNECPFCFTSTKKHELLGCTRHKSGIIRVYRCDSCAKSFTNEKSI